MVVDKEMAINKSFRTAHFLESLLENIRIRAQYRDLNCRVGPLDVAPIASWLTHIHYPFLKLNVNGFVSLIGAYINESFMLCNTILTQTETIVRGVLGRCTYFANCIYVRSYQIVLLR